MFEEDKILPIIDEAEEPKSKRTKSNREVGSSSFCSRLRLKLRYWYDQVICNAMMVFENISMKHQLETTIQTLELLLHRSRDIYYNNGSSEPEIRRMVKLTKL